MVAEQVFDMTSYHPNEWLYEAPLEHEWNSQSALVTIDDSMPMEAEAWISIAHGKGFGTGNPSMTTKI